MHNLNESEIKETVKKQVKGRIIDSKYHDESITFGQAIVTHHFFN
jgi:hypothetical protein